jgi:hypothetical protein
MAGPWSGIRPRLAVILLSDTRPWAEHGVNLCHVCSRVFTFPSAVSMDKLFGYRFKHCLYKFYFKFEQGL